MQHLFRPLHPGVAFFCFRVYFAAQVMIPDVSVLSRLLDPACPYNPTTAAAAVAAASTPVQGQPATPNAGVVAAAAAAAAAAVKGGAETKGQWKDSLRAINDIILRRHFADLTR